MANTKVQSEQIEDGSITADKLADGTIVAAELADNAVVTAAINADAVTGAKIADNAINSEHYTDGSIDTAHIADSQITVGKMAANSVDSDQYVDGSIDTVHIADLQVTTAKIANGNISTAKIADNAVTSAKIDTNIDIAGTFDVTGATTLDSTLAVAGDANFDSGTLFVDVSANKIGIGTTSPTRTVDINHASTAPDLRLGCDGNDAPMIIFDADVSSAGDTVSHLVWRWNNTDIALITGFAGSDTTNKDDGGLSFSTRTSGSATAERMRILSSGNVGIGTTSPVGKLDVSVASNQRIRLDDFGGTSRISSRNDSATILALNIDASDLILNSGSGGKVGIGTTSPVFKLHLKDAANTAVYQKFTNDTTGNTANDGSTIGIDSDGDFLVANAEAKDIKFFTSDTERMRVNSSGQFLLGTTSNNSDSYKMIVDGGGGSKGIDVRGISYNANNGAFRSVPSGNTTYLFAAMLNSSNSTVGSIVVTSANTTYNTSSDYRLKENITPLENGLDRLNQLKPVNFNWIESGKEEEGFIAHEVKEVFPYAVTGEKDAVKDDGTVSPQTMDYGRITPLLVKAIQEQQTIIEAQTTSINDLKTRIEALES